MTSRRRLTRWTTRERRVNRPIYEIPLTDPAGADRSARPGLPARCAVQPRRDAARAGGAQRLSQLPPPSAGAGADAAVRRAAERSRRLLVRLEPSQRLHRSQPPPDAHHRRLQHRSRPCRRSPAPPAPAAPGRRFAGSARRPSGCSGPPPSPSSRRSRSRARTSRRRSRPPMPGAVVADVRARRGSHARRPTPSSLAALQDVRPAGALRPPRHRRTRRR